MGKVVVSQFITLDGVVEDPGGAEKFEHGGWAFRFERGPEGDRFKLDEVMAAQALLLGRVTYEGFAKAWPSMQNEFADKFNSMPKYVVSSTLKDPEWTNTTVLDGDLGAAVSALKEALDGDILVNGSIQLVQDLAARGLVDEWRLMLYPTVLGGGKRLFADGAGPLPLRLASTLAAGETVVLTYVPAGPQAQTIR
jgi:dihydrofolate reductase